MLNIFLALLKKIYLYTYNNDQKIKLASNYFTIPNHDTQRMGLSHKYVYFLFVFLFSLIYFHIDDRVVFSCNQTENIQKSITKKPANKLLIFKSYSFQRFSISFLESTFHLIVLPLCCFSRLFSNNFS